MSRIVKNCDSFSDEDRLDEMWGLDDLKGMLGKIMPTLGEGFNKALKQKLTGIIMSKFGILEKSDLSALVQEIVDAIPLADIPDIISGNKNDGEYWAPIISQSIQEYLERKGIDPIFEKIGIDPTGWIATTIRTTLQTQLGKDKLEKMILFAFDGAMGKDASSMGATALDSLDPAQKNQFNDAFSRAAGQVRPAYSTYVDDKGKFIDQDKKNSGGGILDTITSLLSGGKNNDQ